MSKKLRIAFFVFGLVSIVLMIFGFDLTWSELKEHLSKSGYYFIGAILLWLVVYAVNTLSWQIIIRGISQKTIPFPTLYKFTVSGFALNYVTPGGMNGGEPYRILELKEYIGTPQAVSSTILYSVAHVGSHILLWIIASLCMMIAYSKYIIPSLVVFLLGLLVLFLLWAILKKGAVQVVTNVARKLPWLGKSIDKALLKHADSLRYIDEQIHDVCTTRLHLLSKIIAIEFVARLIGCLEILLIPLFFHLSYLEAYLVVAISSLMGNLLFFMPMQLGGREGGFVLAFSMLGISTSYGIFTAILFRVRELILIVIGIALIQLKGRGKKKEQTN